MFPVTKYGLLRLLPKLYDVTPPRGPKVTYCRHTDSARLQWERDGVLSFYRFELRGGNLWADQTICVNDRVIRRERHVSVEQLRNANLYELANLIEGRKYF